MSPCTGLLCNAINGIFRTESITVILNEPEIVLLTECENSLQVERVRGLKYLILEGFRELKELAILDCFDMEELVLYNTELTSLRMNGLDMKKLSIDGLNKSSLEQLNVFENTNLSSIDVGEYPKLKELVIGDNTEVLNNSNEELKITVWDSGN